MNVVIVCSVQALYIYRVYLLGSYHRKWAFQLLTCCMIAFITTFAFGLVLVIKTYTSSDLTDVKSFSWVIKGSFGASTISDFVIAGAMCYYLRMCRSDNFHLNSRLSSVLHYVVNSGLLTGACSTAALLAAQIAQADTMVFSTIGLLHPKLYITSYLPMMISRQPRETQERSPLIRLHGDSDMKIFQPVDMPVPH